MDKQRRETWTCVKCSQPAAKQKTTSTPIVSKKVKVAPPSTSTKPLTLQLNTEIHATVQDTRNEPISLFPRRCSTDNITLRQYNLPVQNSFASLSDEESDDNSILQNSTLNRSCPNISSHNYKDEVDTLKARISHLQEKLASSDSYITKLLLENDDLTKQISKHALQIEHLKMICKSTKTVNKLNKTLNQTDSQRDQNENDQQTVKLSIAISKEGNFNRTQNTENSSTDSNILDADVPPDTSVSSKDHIDAVNPKIYIVGGNMCLGLASAIIRSREKTPYGKYVVSSVIKPNARCEDILSPLHTISAKSDDVIIINLGENDSNPTKLLAELSYFRKLHLLPHMIIMSVVKSCHLNEQKLNDALKLFCNNLGKCTFLDLNGVSYNSYNYEQVLCSKLNFLIDCLYYNSKYLTFNVLKNNGVCFPLSESHTTLTVQNIKGDKKKVRQGRITDYLSFIKKAPHTMTESNTTVTQSCITDYFSQARPTPKKLDKETTCSQNKSTDFFREHRRPQ